MNYYAIKVVENKEIFVKDKIAKLFKDIKIHIPLIKVKKTSGNHISTAYEKAMPEYLIVECDKCQDRFKKIQTLEHVELILEEEIPYREIKKFLRNEPLQLNLKSEVEILDGLNSRSTAKLISVLEDTVVLAINKTKINLPVWSIEQNTPVDDLLK